MFGIDAYWEMHYVSSLSGRIFNFATYKPQHKTATQFLEPDVPKPN